MEPPLSSTLYSNKRKAHKLPIPIITIDDDSDQNDNEELSPPAAKRDKHERTTETIKDETSASNTLKDNGENNDKLHDLNATEVSNASAIDDDVQLVKVLIQDVLKRQSLADGESSAEHSEAQTVSVAGENNKRMHFQLPKFELIHAPNYEIQEKLNGHRLLVIFVPTNPNLCYNYHEAQMNQFKCFECEKNYRRIICAKLLNDKDGKEFIEANVSHRCEPVQYVANNWHIIQAQNFLVLQHNEKLVVFNLDYPSFCYKYNCNKVSKTYICTACRSVHRKHISAKLIKDENGKECLQANKNHLCDPFYYKISDVFGILKSPNFTLIKDESDDSAAPNLVIYATSVRSTCYNFTQMGSSYACTGCLPKDNYFMAKLYKDETGEEVVLVWKKQNHVCVPISYG